MGSAAGSSSRASTGPALDEAQVTILERLSLATDPDEAAGAGDSQSRPSSSGSRSSRRSSAASIGVLDPVAILATNTSALSIDAIATAAVEHPERVLGLHFFNPAPVMPLVEVVAGRRTTRRRWSRRQPRSCRTGAGRRFAAPTTPASSSTGSTGRSRSRPCVGWRTRRGDGRRDRRGLPVRRDSRSGHSRSWTSSGST